MDMLPWIMASIKSICIISKIKQKLCEAGRDASGRGTVCKSCLACSHISPLLHVPIISVYGGYEKYFNVITWNQNGFIGVIRH